MHKLYHGNRPRIFWFRNQTSHWLRLHIILLTSVNLSPSSCEPEHDVKFGSNQWYHTVDSFIEFIAGKSQGAKILHLLI